MRNLTWRLGLAVVLGVLLCTSPHAEQLTAESMIRLKELGFSDSDIRSYVNESGQALTLSPADIQALKEAGFSDSLIGSLQRPAPAAPPPPPTGGGGAGSGDDRLVPQPAPAEVAPPVQPPPEVAPAQVIPPPQPPAREPAPPAVSRQEMARIQADLNRLGYDAGVEDGVMGPRTAAAIRQFQRDTGLAVDGQPSQGLLKRLASEARKRGRSERRAPPVRSVVGSWWGVVQGNYGYETEMYLDLFPDGHFTSSSSSAMGYAESAGTYQVQGSALILRNEYGQSETYRFRRSGENLIVTMPQLGAEVEMSPY